MPVGVRLRGAQRASRRRPAPPRPGRGTARRPRAACPRSSRSRSFAASAEFQRQQIVKGTREGLDAARARGRVGGRPRALTSEQITDARILLGAGQTRTAVAARVCVSRWTLSRAFATASR
ncbi:helix-turn-helix domain-containing protein [Actinomadura luteofluorescens]|uniref:helix-turn-helix domain-containing protein n=1 Tax=Actinomadura luteofluorescens TaxID=46163 RepID=UPI00349549BD